MVYSDGELASNQKPATAQTSTNINLYETFSSMIEMEKEQIFRVVCATRTSNYSKIWTDTYIGVTVNRFPSLAKVQFMLYTNNTGDNVRGLPDIYNEEIRASVESPAILVFVHDDVLLSDFHWHRHVYMGLQHFDMIGVAGCTTRRPYQSTWRSFCGVDEQRGLVEHMNMKDDIYRYDNYGPTPSKVVSLDGLFLAVHSDTLIKNNITFDELFMFHFYDLDISRQFEEKNLTMGTWPISVVHGGKGVLDHRWKTERKVYMDKWEGGDVKGVLEQEEIYSDSLRL